MVDLTSQRSKDGIEIRPYVPSDLPKIISMIKRSDSTDRSELTWSDNRMTGTLGFDGKKLIGAIPFEPRDFVLGNNEYIKVLWVSGAHVDPDYRSQGLGEKLDQQTRKIFYPNYQGIFVYRGDENSLAYKWYSRLGYQVLLPILSLKIDIFSTGINVNDLCFKSLEEMIPIETEIFNCYQDNSGSFGGGSYRHKSFWSEKIKAHYYQNFYRYFVLFFPKGTRIESYAILGETDFIDGVKRFDILEYSCPDGPMHCEKLISGIMNEAQKRNIPELRIQLSNEDPGFLWFQKLGFQFRWRTNLMGKLINTIEYFSNQLKKNNEIETCSITIETPSLGKNHLGTGKNELGLFMSDQEWVRFLLNRTNLETAIEEGRIILTQSNIEILQLLKSVFPKRRWQYHQIDYI